MSLLNSNISMIEFNSYFTWKDGLVYMIYVLGMLWIVLIIPNKGLSAENYIEVNSLVTPEAIVPEPYLLGYY